MGVVEGLSHITFIVRNLDRMKTIVTDTTLVEEVSVKGLAEQFRLQVKSWAPQPFGELKISDQR